MTFSRSVFVYDDIMLVNTSYRRNLGVGGVTGSKSPPSIIFLNLKIAFYLLSSKGANKKVELFYKRLFGWSDNREKRETCVLRNAE